MESRQTDRKPTAQVRIDAGWRDVLAHLRIEQHRSIRSLVEEALSETYSSQS